MWPFQQMARDKSCLHYCFLHFLNVNSIKWHEVSEWNGTHYKIILFSVKADYWSAATIFILLNGISIVVLQLQASIRVNTSEKEPLNLKVQHGSCKLTALYFHSSLGNTFHTSVICLNAVRLELPWLHYLSNDKGNPQIIYVIYCKPNREGAVVIIHS